MSRQREENRRTSIVSTFAHEIFCSLPTTKTKLILIYLCRVLSAKQIEDDNQDDSSVHFEYERMIRLDSERTFLGVAQQKTFPDVLSCLRQEFGSYYQVMSYGASFLLLTRSPLMHTYSINFLLIVIRMFIGTYSNIIFSQKRTYKNGSLSCALVVYRSKYSFDSSRYFSLDPCLHHPIFSYFNSLQV